MADVDLRPMTLGEVLDRTFKLYKNHFWLFAGITALPFLLVLVIEIAVAAFGAVNRTAQTPQIPPNLLPSAVVGGVLTAVIYLLMIGYAHAATVFAVSDLFLARPTGVRGSFRRVGAKVFRILLIFLLIGLVIGGGFLMIVMVGALLKSPAIIVLLVLLAIFPAFFFFCRTAVAVPTGMLEDRGAVRSLERSMQLTKGHAWQIFLIFLLVAVLTYAVVFIFQMPIMFLLAASVSAHQTSAFGLLVLQHLAEFISQVLVGPIGTIAFSLMYYNLRVRKEAFDIQHLMASLGAAPAPSAPSAA